MEVIYAADDIFLIVSHDMLRECYCNSVWLRVLLNRSLCTGQLLKQIPKYQEH